MPSVNWKNRTLFHGDNLDFMRAMNSESVDLIATDPPFNKGRDFHATPDSLSDGASFQDRWSWDNDVHQEWIDSIKDDHKKLWAAIVVARRVHSDSMGAFCCFLGVRLLAMRRILKPTGSIYLHCDQTANSYIRMMMDAVFGPKNIVSDITWRRTPYIKGNSTRRYQTNTDTIYSYAKDINRSYFSPCYLPLSDKYISSCYTKVEDSSGRRYRLVSITAPIQNPSSNLHYEIFGITKTWRWNKDRMMKAISSGKVIQTNQGSLPTQKQYLDESKGVPIDNLWNDIDGLAPQSKERVGYPTQKPTALYERIIKASCPERGIVLDPFAGCATTCVAAERLGRQWVGIDLWPKASDVIVDRMQRECDGIFGGDVTVTDKIPDRTDSGKTASTTFKTPTSTLDAKRPSMTRSEMVDALIERDGLACQGCDWAPHHSDYLHIDHRIPRSEGGSNDIENRTLLCQPCNSRKSNTLTLTGLRKKNKKEKRMMS